MRPFQNQPIPQGVRQRTTLDPDEHTRLALSIQRQDGGVLHIIVADDMVGCEEREHIQDNTFQAVMPLARLPIRHEPLLGHPKVNGALPRAGRLYVFRDNKLWRELECDGSGNLFEVDVTLARERRTDERPAVGVAQSVFLVPVMLKGRFVLSRYVMAYSEVRWPWSYIEWLEQQPGRITRRCQPLQPVWNASINHSRWRPTPPQPAVVIDTLRPGLRTRDFNIESALEDPAEFVPALSVFPEASMTHQMQLRQTQLASVLEDAPPDPLPDIEQSEDVLSSRDLRGHPNLVGLMLEDPLFELRHAASQVRHCGEYLRTLNALVPHQPHGRYAQALSHLLDGPLQDLRDGVKQKELDKTVFSEARKRCREHMGRQIELLLELLDGPLQPALLDWAHQRNEALIEPYSLLVEALDALNQLPDRADALYSGNYYRPLAAKVDRTVKRLLEGSHPIGALLLVKDETALPEQVRRLQALIAESDVADPGAMGLSTLMQGASLALPADNTGTIDYVGFSKSVAYFLSDLMDIFGHSVIAHITRLGQASSRIYLDRLFAPAFNTLQALSVKMKGIQLLPAGDIPVGMVIVGVDGAGLRTGLTDFERHEITRRSYRRAIIHDGSGNPIASTSPNSTGLAEPNLRDVRVVAVPADHPELASYSQARTRFGLFTEVAEKTQVVPTMMVGLAVFNLKVQLEALLSEQNNLKRATSGLASAIVDIAAALGSHSKLLLGNYFTAYINKPRLPVRLFSEKWADNLKKQTGSDKLPLLRAFGAGATLVGAALSAWDSYQSFEDQDLDIAAAYGIAAVGGAFWSAAAAGLTINPLVFGIGVALTIGGALAASYLSNSDIEIVINNGPFGHQLGRNARFKHLWNDALAWQQLVGIFCAPTLTIKRFADWYERASQAHRLVLNRVDSVRVPGIDTSGPREKVDYKLLAPDDWVVVLHSPLLPVFENDYRNFRLTGEESLITTPISPKGWSGTRRAPAGLAKVKALALDATSAIYVLAPALPPPQLGLMERYRVKIRRKLKILGQFELSTQESERSVQPFVLPQPSPKKWKDFEEKDRHIPKGNTNADNPPAYWLIDTGEYRL